MIEVWEGVADAVHSETGADDAPVSAFLLAGACGLRLSPWGRNDGALIGESVRYPRNARPTRQHGLISHEVGHWALGWCGEDDSEEGARYVGGALMLPRQSMERALRRGARLPELMETHSNASGQLIAYRICQLSSAVVSIVDQGKVSRRVHSPWLASAPAICGEERDLVDRACSGSDDLEGEGCYGVALFDGHFRRVIVIKAVG